MDSLNDDKGRRDNLCAERDVNAFVAAGGGCRSTALSLGAHGLEHASGGEPRPFARPSGPQDALANRRTDGMDAKRLSIARTMDGNSQASVIEENTDGDFS